MSKIICGRAGFLHCLKGSRTPPLLLLLLRLLLLLPMLFGSPTLQAAPAEIILSKTDLEIPEGGSTIIEMTLSRKPEEPVQVSWKHDDELVRINENDQAGKSVVFSDRGSSWDIPRRFRIEARGNTQVGHAVTTLTATAKSGDGDFDDVTAAVTLKILDDDGVTLNITSKQLSLKEGEPGNFTVGLSKPPSEELIVSISSDDPGAVRVSREKLTFGVGLSQTITMAPTGAGGPGAPQRYDTTPYSISQKVRVIPVPDRDKNNETVTILLEGPEKILSNPRETVTVEVYDDDQNYLVLSKPKMTLDEDSSEHFRVRLSRRPAGSVKVSLTASGEGILLFGRDELTFTPSNWNAGQAVRVRASQDDDSSDEQGELRFRVSGGVYDGLEQKMDIEVRDDDTPGLVLSSSQMSVPEGGAETLTVRLATQPTANVRLTLGQPENADIALDTDSGLAGNQNTLIFTPKNWNQARQVTVSAASDADAVDDSGSVPINSEGGEYSGMAFRVEVQVIEDEVAGLALQQVELWLTEGGPSERFTVALASEPTKRVRVKLSSSDRTAARVRPKSLVFRPSDWSEPQTVTVRPMSDDDTEDERARVNLAASGGDYSGVTAHVLVRVKDDDSRMKGDRQPGQGGNTGEQVRDSEARLSIGRAKSRPGAPGEGRTRRTGTGRGVILERSTVPAIEERRRTLISPEAGFVITLIEDCDVWALVVMLAGEPTDLVEVELSSSIPESALIEPARLVFTPSNWSEIQTVAMRPVEGWTGELEQVHVRLQGSGAPEYEDVSTSVLVRLADKEECDEPPDPMLEQILCVLWLLAWLLLILVLLILIPTIKRFLQRARTGWNDDPGE